MQKTKLTVNERAYLVNAPESIKKYIRKVFTLDNPEFLAAEKHGRFTGHLDRYLLLYAETADSISFPRGWTRNCIELLEQNGIQFEIEDNRRVLEPVELTFQGSLRGYQELAVWEIRRRDFGVLEASTGSGKTVTALKVIEERQQPSLILVHTRELLFQWAERIRQFLGIEPGLIGDGKFSIGPVTVAIVHTARKHLDELPQYFGHLIVDECHRAPSSMFREVVTAFDCRFMLGLTATPYRRDGLGKLVFLTLGDRTHKVDPDELREDGAVLSPEVVRRETGFTYNYEDDYQPMLTALVEDQERNEQIADDVIQRAAGDRDTCLVVSDRVQHCETLAAMLQDRGAEVRVLTGKTPRKQRERIVEEVQAGEVNVLLSTLQLLGEGFDCAGLSALFLATPVRFKGRLLQVVGRILRPADGKRPVVYDYQDSKVGVLRAQARARERAFAEVAA
jgi:superfamily II DNA or RNA helicase